MIDTILLVLVIAGWIYWVVALALVRAFLAHPRTPDSTFAPPVSLLKPLKGLDPGIYENFSSFCRQDYPKFELLFGVEDAHDPVVPLVEELQRQFPDRRIQLIVAPAIHVNPKASILQHLAAAASYDVLVVSDSDMRVTPDYLRRVVSELADARVGLVTCLYRGHQPLTVSARLEALYIGTTFLPSVLVARPFLNMRFALGATVALRGRDLARIGGFAAVGDYLADDYQLGAQIAALGLDVRLSDYIVDSVLHATTLREQWQREVRWAHCTRLSRPLEYPGLLLTFSTPFAALLVVVSAFSSAACSVLFVSLLLRWFVAWRVTGCTGDENLRPYLAWLPVRDVLTALVWVAGAVGRRVVWRGEEYILQPDGRLVAVREPEPCPAEDLG